MPSSSWVVRWDRMVMMVSCVTLHQGGGGGEGAGCRGERGEQAQGQVGVVRVCVAAVGRPTRLTYAGPTLTSSVPMPFIASRRMWASYSPRVITRPHSMCSGWGVWRA